jgi:excisionase family DNA binding protein
MKAPQEALLTPEEVAAMLRVARKTVVVMARENKLPCIRIGRFVRFDRQQIARWIDDNRS